MTIGMHQRIPGKPCTHRLYLLTCEDYEALLLRARTRCEICGTPAEETPAGTLVIDHDYQVGNWAVRGLLCSRCNSGLARLGSHEARAYLASPWYREALAAKGLNADVLPEPSVGARVRIAPRGHEWIRTDKGWRYATARYRGLPLTWRRLNSKFGPFNIGLLGTDAYVRKIARDNGIEPAKKGGVPSE